MMKVLEHLLRKERLRDLGLFSLEKRRFREDLKGHKEDRARLVSVVPSDRTRDKHRSFCLNIRKHFFTVRVTEHWHSLPREVVEFPSLEKQLR